MSRESVQCKGFSGRRILSCRLSKPGQILDRNKQHGMGLLWDCPIIEHPLNSAQQLMEAKLKNRRNVFQTFVLHHWRHELKVYARLGYWAPDLIPEGFQNIIDQVTTAAEPKRSNGKVNGTSRTQNIATNPCLQTNPSKRFLHRFGGLQEFYRHLREDRLSGDEFSMAIHLCPFGLTIGLKRTSKNIDPKLLRRGRYRRPTVRTSNMTDLCRILQTQRSPSGGSRQASPLELKGMINQVLLSNLNPLKPISAYQNQDLNADISTSGALVDIPQNDFTEKTSIHSVTSECASSFDDEADEDVDEEKSDTSGGGEVALNPNTGDYETVTKEIHKPTSDTRNRIARSSVNALTESSDLSSLETLNLPGRELQNKTGQTLEVGNRDSQIVVKPDKTCSMSVCEPRRTFKKLMSIIKPATAISSAYQSRKSTRSSSLSRGLPRRSRMLSVIKKKLVPDMKEQMPVNLLVRGMLDELTTEARPSKWSYRTEAKDNWTHQILQMSKKTQPIIMRVLREQNTWLKATAERSSKTSNLPILPDHLARAVSEKSNCDMLPALLPLRNTVSSDRIDSASVGIRTSGAIERAERTDLVTSSRTHKPSLSVTAEMQYKPLLLFPTGNLGNRNSYLSCPVDTQSTGTVGTVGTTKTDDDAQKDGQGRLHNDVFMLPRLPPKPKNILFAVRYELRNQNPFVFDYFLQTMNRIIPEDRWQVERSTAKLVTALERIGADLLLYRHSSGHAIRFKLMSVIAAADSNRTLRRQMRLSAGLQGNWLDQLLRSLSSIHSSCRVEATLAITRLVTGTRLMQQLFSDRKNNLVADILYSLLRASDIFPENWPEFYATIAFLLQYNQRQTVLDCLLDRNIQFGSVRAATMWPRLVALVYTYWRKLVLQKLTVNEKRVGILLDAALCHPITRRGAREAIAAISEYHTLNSKLVSLWTSDTTHQQTPQSSELKSDYGILDTG
ncbi:unnamed protein product [Echinostoma caproni]|uniref:Phosphodiesterase I n=1 Tax=Echinostoma caproni TaxID=27848 RepID=A0A183B4H7_9TREM|nr:unnamed protein product [Echinostoma caproni]